jgi:hypothetical protein
MIQQIVKVKGARTYHLPETEYTEHDLGNLVLKEITTKCNLNMLFKNAQFSSKDSNETHISGHRLCEKCFHPRQTTNEVDHPSHYGGADNPYEAIKVIEAWGLGFNLGNCIKYISRAGKKETSNTLVDLQKALWYLRREIERNH